MGGTARQFQKMYINYKKRFKKPINFIAQLMPLDFSDSFFVSTFKRLYPNMWEDLQKQYQYWHTKNDVLIKYGKKSRYNFRKPYNFILDCSYYCRKKLRKDKDRIILSRDECRKKEQMILEQSLQKQRVQKLKEMKTLCYIQEIEPIYTKKFITQYFRTHDLHERLEIIRELSKYKSKLIIEFFYKVNACTRNQSLKRESMRYIQSIGLPFVLRRKKKGKKNYIDNEIVKNKSSPEVLMQRLYVDKLEKLKHFDIFISHNSKDENMIIDFYKALNSQGYVAYIDWVNDKFDLKRQWCNATTAQIIKERIKQSKIVVLVLTKSTLASQWCPWEIGYADAINKKICVYALDTDLEYIPQFYKAYPSLIVEDKIWIETCGNRVLFSQWFNSGKEEKNGE